jgi:hypothetical protein
LITYIGFDEEALAALRQVMAVVRGMGEETVQQESRGDGEWIVL